MYIYIHTYIYIYIYIHTHVVYTTRNLIFDVSLSLYFISPTTGELARWFEGNNFTAHLIAGSIYIYMQLYIYIRIQYYLSVTVLLNDISKGTKLISDVFH